LSLNARSSLLRVQRDARRPVEMGQLNVGQGRKFDVDLKGKPRP